MRVVEYNAVVKHVVLESNKYGLCAVDITKHLGEDVPACLVYEIAATTIADVIQHGTMQQLAAFDTHKAYLLIAEPPSDTSFSPVSAIPLEWNLTYSFPWNQEILETRIHGQVNLNVRKPVNAETFLTPVQLRGLHSMVRRTHEMDPDTLLTHY